MKYIIELSISHFAFGYKISYLIDFFHGTTCDKGVDTSYIQTEKKTTCTSRRLFTIAAVTAW